MELSIDEQTLVACYRNLDEHGKKELLRHASQQHTPEACSNGLLNLSGQCKLDRCEQRPETAAEPIFTE